MIQFKAGKKPGQTDIVGFGITDRNIEQLKAGNPIIVLGKEMNLPFDIMILYGATEAAITAELIQAGFVDGDTIVHPSKTRQ